MTSAEHVALALLEHAIAHPERRSACFKAIAAIMDVGVFVRSIVVSSQPGGRLRREALALGNSHALQRELAEEGT